MQAFNFRRASVKFCLVFGRHPKLGRMQGCAWGRWTFLALPLSPFAFQPVSHTLGHVVWLATVRGLTQPLFTTQMRLLCKLRRAWATKQQTCSVRAIFISVSATNEVNCCIFLTLHLTQDIEPMVINEQKVRETRGNWVVLPYLFILLILSATEKHAKKLRIGTL